MHLMVSVFTAAAALGLVVVPTAANELTNRLDALEVETARININPWGANLGFELEVSGDDRRLAPLLHLIREAPSGPDHKCANVGAVRLRMRNGDVLGIGLLPSHTEGRFDLRLYEGDRYLGVVQVDRERLLAVLAVLGLPPDDPWLAR